ncbi:hypothetical protein Tco_0424893, partial [Tanacetum coccineum]
MEFNIMINLPKCSCDRGPTLKKHNDLLKLLQFLMGLDEVYAPIKSQILTTEPLPDVKSNDWKNNKNNGQTSQNKGFVRNTTLVYKQCHMTGHTLNRCFELIRYPSGFKKRSSNSQFTGTTANNAVPARIGNVEGITHALTSDQYKRLINLLSSSGGNHADAQVNIAYSGASQHVTYCAKLLFDIINVDHFNITITHPNRTIEKVKQIGSFQLSNKIVLKYVLVVPGYHVCQARTTWVNTESNRSE